MNGNTCFRILSPFSVAHVENIVTLIVCEWHTSEWVGVVDASAGVIIIH